MRKEFKFLAFLVSVLIILQSMFVFADTDITIEETETEQTVEEVEPVVKSSPIKPENADVMEDLLGELKIVTDGEGKKPTDQVTRVEYLKYILNMLKAPNVEAEKQLFFDVPLTDSNVTVINSAYVMGLIMGNADGTACPENPITLDEAIIIAIRALNATGLSKSYGSDYLSYMQTASKLGLYDGVKTTSSSVITREDALRVIYNTITSEYITTLNGVDLNVNETTILEKTYNISKTRGIVTACSYGNIYGGDVAHSGDVVIGETTFRYNDDASRELLGASVVLYYTAKTDDGVPKILYMYGADNNYIDIDVEDVTAHKQGSLKYLANGGQKNSSLKLSSTALTLINGTRAVVGSSGITLPLHGTVRAIDNDNDGVYDVILYSKYEIAVAVTVNEVEEKLYNQKGTYVALDLSEYKEYHIYDTEKNELSLLDITKDAVLNISENADKNIIDIVVCKDTVEVTVNSSYEESYGNRKYLYLEDESGAEYVTVSDFADISDDNKMLVNNTTTAFGKKYTFGLNSDGKIAVILDWSEASLFSYGYLISVQVPTSIGNPYVRILGQDNKVILTDVAKKVRVITGEISKSVTSKDYAENYAKQGIMRYKLDADGNLNSVELPQDETAETGFRKSIALEGPALNTKNRYISKTGLVGGRIAVTENTYVFFTPDSTHTGDIDAYRAGTVATDLSSGRYFPYLEAYKYDDDIYADVLITETNNSTVKTDTNLLIKSINKTVDKSGNECVSLSGLANGAEAEYILDYACYNEKEGYVLGEGDIITITTGFGETVVGYRPIYDCSENYAYDYGSKYEVFGDDGFNIVGQIEKFYDNRYLSYLNGGMTANRSLSADNLYPIDETTKVYMYNKDARKEKCTITTMEEIPTLDVEPTSTSKVVVIIRDSSINLAVIYK